MRKLKIILLTALAIAALQVAIGVTSVAADPHPGQSVNVVVIGGPTLDISYPCSSSGDDANVMGFTHGGCLPVTGPAGELGDFIFTAMSPGSVSAVSLAPFDTAVLNMASNGMDCSSASLTSTQLQDVVDFVGAGKKLIIVDSECYPGPIDYSWLPYPFTTANPGALGQPGQLKIVEQNTLSTTDQNPALPPIPPTDPHYINANQIASGTDAIGDMNVMTTFDSHWCVDMSGTNAIGVTGPVQTYAKYPAGTDQGLILYNGMDWDYLSFSPDADLRKTWVQLLQQPINPSNLPCGVTVVGISLTPDVATNTVGSNHMVTATLQDLLNNPQPGVEVTFSVESGPNTGTSGTCSVNADCSTDANGRVSFTYPGDGGVGTDTIKACFTDLSGPSPQEKCDEATKTWEPQQHIIGIPGGPQLAIVVIAGLAAAFFTWVLRRRGLLTR